jgi:hypothetical protein
VTKLLLNAVRIESDPKAKLAVGRQPFDGDILEQLRNEHRHEYLVRRGGEDGLSILSVALVEGLKPLGDAVEDQLANQAPWLLAPLTLDALLRLFTGLGREVIGWRPLRVLSQQPSNLIPADSELPHWLQRRVVFSFDTRSIRTSDKQLELVLMCGVRTTNQIDADCGTIVSAGIPIEGKYVTAYRPRSDERLRGTYQLAGRVAALQGSRIVLEDHGDGPSSIELADAFLENRKENLVWCADRLLGPKAARVLDAADQAASEHVSGPGRLGHTRRMFDYLRRQDIELAPGVPLRLGPFAGSVKGSWNFSSEVIKRPTLVFDPSGTRTDTWNERGLDKNGPYDQRSFTPKELRIAVVCQAAFEGQVDRFLAKFLEGLPGIKSRDRVPYEKGFIRRYALQKPTVQIFTSRSSSVAEYAAACREAIETATNDGVEWNLALVQIDKAFRDLPGVKNPYFTVKAAFLKQRVPVQEITLDTMSMPDERLVYALNNMSVATYAKVGGVPWLLKSHPSVAHELVIGIGSQNISSFRLGGQERVVGITTVFSSDGRYLLENRTAAVSYDDYPQELFKSLAHSIEQVRKTDNWRSTDDVRLIFHVFKQIKDLEADAVAKLVDNLGLAQVKYAFLHVVDDHPFTLFDEAQPGIRWSGAMKGALAPERGLSVVLSDAETLLCFTGSREVKLPHHGLPQPSLLKLHRKSTFRDMTYLARQAFDFSCHSWRMFTPAPLPITILYSELIARLLAGLRDIPNWDPDTMLGSIGRTRWFL